MPDSMIIRDKIHFSSSVQPYISGGFADLNPGHYKDRTVAVKTMRVAATDDLERMRKVRLEKIFRLALTPSFSGSASKSFFGESYPIQTS